MIEQRSSVINISFFADIGEPKESACIRRKINEMIEFCLEITSEILSYNLISEDI